MMLSRATSSNANTSSISSGVAGATDLDAERPPISTRVSLPQLQNGIEAMKRSLELLTAAQQRQNGENQSHAALAQATIAE